MKKVFFPLILFLTVSGLLSCQRENVPDIHKGTAVIAGNILSSGNTPSGVVSLISVNALESNRYSEIPDTNGNFLFRFDVLHPHDINIRYKDGFVGLYIHPSDSIFLEMDEKAFEDQYFPRCHINGKDVNTAKAVYEYYRFKKVDNFTPSFEGDPSVPVYLEQIKRHMVKDDSILALFVKKFHPSEEFLRWARNDIIYSNANYLVDYEYHHYVNKTKIVGDLFDKRLFPVENDVAIVSMMYGYHLWHYSTFKYIKQDTLVSGLLKDNKKADAYRLILSRIIENEKAGLSRDIMCYRILKSLFSDSYNDFKTVWDEPGYFMGNKTLISMLVEQKEEHDKLKDYDISFFDPLKQEEKAISGDFWINLKKKHKGKVIYLDIWAVWCGPCRSEIPYAYELHEYFKGQPVVFVNVCLSSERTAWKNLIDKMHINGENYFFNKDQTKLFVGNLRDFQGYPTYLIIDKNGNIVDFHAPPPSSGEEIRKRIEEML